MKIHVCIACDDNYSPHAAALIASIMKNKNKSDELSFHILSDRLSPDTKKKMEILQKKWDFEISFLEFTDDMFHGLPKWFGGYTTYFRLVMHRLISSEIKKIIYLDCDMIVTTSLAPLYETDIKEKYGAVVAEREDSCFTTHSHWYFNAGMILLNLEKYRSDDIENRAMKIGMERTNEIEVVDQDLLNEVFQGDLVYLPLRWNVMLFPSQIQSISEIYKSRIVFTDEDLKDAWKNPFIAHYVSGGKPWDPGCTHPHSRLYWKYLKRTPFYHHVKKNYRRKLPKVTLTSWIRRYNDTSRFLRLFIFKSSFRHDKKYLRIFGITLIDSIKDKY